jgi:hypothetical protein
VQAQLPESFTEEAFFRGISYATVQGHAWGRGVAFIDLDVDGDADLVCVGAEDGRVGVFENAGDGCFTDHSASSGIPLMPEASCVVAGDYDSDGDEDLFISAFYEPCRLLRNDGAFTFTDVTASSGIDLSERHSGAAWGDFNGDGLVDLYATERHAPNHLFENQGDGTFVDMAIELGVEAGNDPTFQPLFFDHDLDGDADLYLATDKGELCESNGWHNHLYENQGDGTFIDITESSGTMACVDAMCIAVGDFDRNGFPDLYCTSTPPGNALLMNQGDGTYLEQAESAGVAVFELGWASIFFDYDNDTWPDLYVNNMWEGNRLFSGGGWPCGNLAPQLNINDPGQSFSAATADVDLDGDLDVLQQNRGEPLRLYMNNEGERRGWARFRVAGDGLNTKALGAIVRVRVGTAWQVLEVVAGSNFKNQNELVRHFGLGTARAVDETEVRWPQGGPGGKRTLTGYEAGHTWTVHPADRLGDADEDGLRTLADFHALVACAADAFEPGCEVMDIDGDADVDGDDLDLLLRAFTEPLLDCNGNGAPDLQDIFEGLVADTDGNGIPDPCQLEGDVNGDGTTGVADLAQVINSWGHCSGAPCPGDADLDGDADVYDLLAVLGNWG